ncbi:MAG TPA: 6-phosphogluconolactonase [Terriglobales bacterium]|nr:6-phosphogluconolactonase [Terriglobales bacterium]
MQNLSIKIFDDRNALNAGAAGFWQCVADNAIVARGRFSVALSGGSTPKALYELLAQSPWKESLPWSKTHIFLGDERNVPAGDPPSNFRMANEALLSKVKIPAENIHRVRTELKDPQKVAADYERTLRELFPGAPWPQIDLNLLGLGENGHTASLFPHTPVLHDDKDWIAGLYIEEVKMERITLTVPAINHSRNIAFFISGASKAQVVHDILHGPRDPERLPAQLIQAEAGNLIWLLDRPAAALLPNS